MIGTPIKLVEMARDVALDLTDAEKIALAVEIIQSVRAGGNGPALRSAARQIEQHAQMLGRGEGPRRSDGSIIHPYAPDGGPLQPAYAPRLPQGRTTSPCALATPPEGSHPSGAFNHKKPRPQFPPLAPPEDGNSPSQRSSVARGWGRLKRVLRWLDGHWIGDLLALICLAGTVYIFLVMGWVLS